MNKFARFASIALVLAGLSACGAKGPLFLPEKPVPVEDAPAAPQADAPATGTPATDATLPVEPPVEEPAAPPTDRNG
ncbi:MAG TPA: lipoprotein [Pseudoxanthomonas sp.]